MAVGQGGDVADVVDREDQHLEIRHAAGKGDIRDGVVVAEVQILDLGAVLKLRGLLVGHGAAAGGGGGEDAFHIRADAVAGEPDAPDDIDVGILVTDHGHVLIGNIGGVHVKGLQPCHVGQNPANFRALVVHPDVAEAQVIGGEVGVDAPDVEGIVQRGVGRGVMDGSNAVPAEAAALGAEVDHLKIAHAAQHRGGFADLGGRHVGEIDFSIREADLAAEQGESIVDRGVRAGGGECGKRIAWDRGAGLCHAEINGLEIRQILEKRGGLGKQRRIHRGEIQRGGIVQIHLAVRQRHRIAHVDIGMRVGPGENLLIAVASGEVGRTEHGEGIQQRDVGGIHNRRQGIDILLIDPRGKRDGILILRLRNGGGNRRRCRSRVRTGGCAEVVVKQRHDAGVAAQNQRQQINQQHDTLENMQYFSHDFQPLIKIRPSGTAKKAGSDGLWTIIISISP